MSFLAPAALWALLALAVPLALHLRRRRVGTTIPVGSIRHLEALPSAERRGLRLRDRRLFLLRALIVSALALLLARPVLRRSAVRTTPFALLDSAAPATLIDSLRGVGTVSIERVDDPWRRLSELDDSLPAGVPLVIAASSSSDRFTGPRPIVGREVRWLPIEADETPRTPDARSPQSAVRVTPLEARALAAALAATAEEFGPLTDTAGWMGRLPDWWRDSLARPAFPVAVARAAAPQRASPAPVSLTTPQLLPRQLPRPARAGEVIDLHWWFWAAALLLFLLERRVATRGKDPT